MFIFYLFSFFFFFNDTATTEIYTLSLHDALPISGRVALAFSPMQATSIGTWRQRSEEHTSELQSRFDLVCRLLLEKKKKLQQILNVCRKKDKTNFNTNVQPDA